MNISKQALGLRNRWPLGLALFALLAAVSGAIGVASSGCSRNVTQADHQTAQSEQAKREAERHGGELTQFASHRDHASDLTLKQIPIDGARAYGYLKQLCALGSRMSGSPGMVRQQEILANHFEKLGGTVGFQKLTVRHPEQNRRVKMANLIVQWHPESKRRILLCAHYDTRPFPCMDPDPRRRRDLFLGANDGASGTALLMELAHYMADLQSAYGVDFVLFDGEEFVFNENRDQKFYFVGSTWFAKQYVQKPPPYRYRYGVLLDMVGDADLQIYQEINSLKFRGVRPLIKEIWSVAKDLKVNEFIPYTKHLIRDDHLPLNNIAKIPTCDIIDFDYPNPRSRVSYWHTTSDVPENCSALSLAKVGWVVHEWLKRAK